MFIRWFWRRGARRTATEEDAAALEGPPLRLGTLPELPFPAETPLDAAEAMRIRALIRWLREIETPDVGLSPTLSGDAFAPLPGSARAGAFMLTSHGLETPPPLRELVALGPRALPFLLESLADPTPTRLGFSSERRNVPFWTNFARELDVHPLDEREQAALAVLEPRLPEYELDGEGAARHGYTVTVGDACFVALGQIVGRRYAAVRYQPSGIMVVNSPSREPRLAAAVRAIWESDRPVRRLFDSLRRDYATEGISDGRSLSGWHGGSVYQCAAARRLLYYFPRESASLIAARLRELDVHAPEPDDLDGFTRREVANGAPTEDLLGAVAWCPEPEIRAAVREVFERTDDPELLLAALPGVAADRPLAERRLVGFIQSPPPGARSVPIYDLLVALGETAGEAAKPVFREYVRDAGPERRRLLCSVLRRTQGQWSVELLAPLLTDRRRLRESNTYAVVPGRNDPRRPLRICDEAALTIVLNFPDLPFQLGGTHAELDRQIAALRARIEGEP